MIDDDVHHWCRIAKKILPDEFTPRFTKYRIRKETSLAVEMTDNVVMVNDLVSKGVSKGPISRPRLGTLRITTRPRLYARQRSRSIFAFASLLVLKNKSHCVLFAANFSKKSDISSG